MKSRFVCRVIAVMVFPVTTWAGQPLVAMGEFHTLLASAESKVFTCGSNSNGQLGTGDTLNSGVPRTLPTTLASATALAGGQGYSLALVNGSVWSWGSNTFPRLGRDTASKDDPNPGLVSGLSGITAITAGYTFAAALKSDGTVWMWGSSLYGIFGDNNTFGTRTTPLVVPNLNNVTAISAVGSAYQHMLALAGDGTVWAWGNNNKGQLGVSDTTSTSVKTPTQVLGLPAGKITAVAAGGEHSLALAQDGTVWAWGKNDDGQVDPATAVASGIKTKPVQVKVSNIMAIAAGAQHSLALDSSGQVWAWGSNAAGQIGNVANSATPAVVTGTGVIRLLAARNQSTLLLRADGGLVGLGGNTEGPLCNGTTANRTAPQLAVDVGVDPATGLPRNCVPRESCLLDLDAAVSNSFSTTLLSPFIVNVDKQGPSTATRLTVNLYVGSSASKSLPVPGNGFDDVTTYDIFVAATLPSGATTVWRILPENNVWADLSYPLAAFIKGYTSSPSVPSVKLEVLNGIDTKTLSGAMIYAGLGTSADQMLATGNYMTIFGPVP